MEFQENFTEANKSSFLIVEKEVIIDVDEVFLDMMGYQRDEVIGNSMLSLCKLIRITPKLDLQSESYEKEYYIFTKNLEYRRVILQRMQYKNQQIYLFKEIPNSRIANNFAFFIKPMEDNKMGIGILKAPDLTIIGANQFYLDCLDAPFDKKETSIGTSLNEVIDWEKIGENKEIWLNVINTKTTFYGKEIKWVTGSRKDNYFNNTIVPVLENGEVKYVVSVIEDVTDKVIARLKNEVQAKIIEQQNQNLVAIIENMTNGVFIAHKNGKISLMNKTARNLFYDANMKYSLFENADSQCYTDLDGNVIPLSELPFQRALRGEIVKNQRIIIKGVEKQLIIEFNAKPIFDGSGDINMVIVSSHDITELIQNEKKIKEQNKQLEAIIDSISDELSIFDRNGVHIKSNKVGAYKVENEKSLKQECCKDKYVYYDLDNRILECKDQPLARTLRGEEVKNYVYMAIGQDKRYICTNGKPVYDDEGNLILAVLSSKDVTSDILHKVAIERQMELLNQLISNLDLPVVRLSNPDLRVIDVNQKACELIKSAKPNLKLKTDILGSNYSEVNFDLDVDKTLEYIQNVINNKRPEYMKNRKWIISGEEMYVNSLFQPIFGFDGDLQEIVAIMFDVTHEVIANKRMENALKLQEEFFANISHELKTPLNVIFSTVQLFNMYLKSGSLEEKRKSIVGYINTIMQNCYRLSKLINNIVDLSKIEAGFYDMNISNNNVVEVVEDIVMSVANYIDSKGLSIVFDTDSEEKIIACDPEKIERILLNLISNAIKFSNTGDEVRVNVYDRNEYVEISVKDNGIGIEESNLAMIFDRFKQVDKSLSRNAEGTGIGLSLVKAIVELHGGKITVESEIGMGSKFTVLLPTTKVMQENMLLNSKMRSRNESIQVELSDIS